ncbi:hypothetical protein D3C78_1382450 [compost metagenome]
MRIQVQSDEDVTSGKVDGLIAEANPGAAKETQGELPGVAITVGGGIDGLDSHSFDR